MKTISDLVFKLVCVYILCLSVFSVSTFEIDTNTTKIDSLNSDKVLNSDILTYDDKEIEEETEEKIVETKSVETKKDETKKEQIKPAPTPTPAVIKPVMVEPTIDVSTVPVLATETITMSHYGHDCSGCKTGETASGYYIGDGNIYYNDSTFGSVRIVAADKKYPFGTILRLNGELAIVLDRGGVGDGKKFQIDLLVSSESESSKLGVKRNVNLEVLRYGY